MQAPKELPIEDEPITGFAIKEGHGNNVRRYDKDVHPSDYRIFVNKINGDPETFTFEGEEGPEAFLTKQKGPKAFAIKEEHPRPIPGTVKAYISDHISRKLSTVSANHNLDITPAELSTAIDDALQSATDDLGDKVETPQQKRERIGQYLLDEIERQLHELKNFFNLEPDAFFAEQKHREGILRIIQEERVIAKFSRQELAMIGYGLELNDPADFPRSQGPYIGLRQNFMKGLVLLMKEKIEQLLQKLHLDRIAHPNQTDNMNLSLKFIYSEEGLQVRLIDITPNTRSGFDNAVEIITVPLKKDE